jgi:hypothetical protein
VTFYNKKNKEIKLEDVIKMEKKGKLDHYVFISNFSSSGNLYTFYVPYDLSYVKFLETEDNKNYMFYFKVVDIEQNAPELPTINKTLR